MVHRNMMKIKTIIAFVLLAILCTKCEGKGGRGGFSSRGGSSSKSSSSGGWFSSKSPSSSSSSGGWFGSKSPSSSSNSYKPSPSYSSPAYSPSSYNSPSSNSYGWNLSPSRPSGISNTNTNTASKPSYGWNVGNNQPVGPPPAYPGLSNRPVANANAPPSYSPSFSNPPAYNPSYSRQPAYNPSYPSQPAYNPSYNSKPSYSSQPAYNPSYNSRPSYSSQPAYSPSYRQQNTYNTHSSYPGSGYNNYNNYRPGYGYGSTFGSGGLGSNTYINNNYYGGSRSGGGSSFLTNALFYGAGMHSGYGWGRSSSSSSSRRSWDSEEDRRWRATTKAPYFENKVPGSESYLPAAAVVGAATAFGLASLLPLNVPANKPLMYCNSTDIAQTQIQLDFNTYYCVNSSVAVSCPRSLENSTIVDECLNKPMDCDVKITENIYCTNGTLISQSSVVCNSTIVLNGTNVNETTTILNCYLGTLSEGLASFIPTTTTEAPIITTTEKQLSMGAKIHVFFMKLIGKSDVIEKAKETTTLPPIDESPRFILKENETLWVPEALTIPPETTTTTTTQAPVPLSDEEFSKRLNLTAQLVETELAKLGNFTIVE